MNASKLCVFALLFITSICQGQKFTLPELSSFMNMDAGKAEDKLQLQKFDVIRKQERGSASAYSYTYWECHSGNENDYLMVSVNEERKIVDGITLELNSKEEYLEFLDKLSSPPYEKMDSIVYGDKSIGEEFKKGEMHIILTRNEIGNTYRYAIEVCLNCSIILKRTATR